jgi:hypothetical protein
VVTETKKAQLELDGADPKLPFYITAWLNLDGSLDISSEGKDALSFATAVESAKDQCDSYGDEAIYVIECRAIRKVGRGKIKVTPFKTKSVRS